MINRSDKFWNVLGGISFSAISFITLIAVSYGGGEDAAGIFSIAFTTAQMLYYVGLFGVNYYQMTDYSFVYSINEYRIAKVFSSSLMIAICIVCIPVLGLAGEKGWETIVFTAFMLLMSIGELQVSYYFQHDLVGIAGKSLTFRSFLSLLLFLICYFFSGSVLAAGIAMFVGGAVGLIHWRIKEKLAPLSKELLRCSGRLLFDCFPLFFASFLISITINVPKYVINFVSTDAVQAYFGMLMMPTLVIALFSQIAFKPVLHDYSKRLQEGKKGFYLLLRKHLLLIFVITLVCVGISALVGVWIMGMIYGISFDGYMLELNLMVACGGLLACCQLMYYLLVVLRAQKATMILNIAAFLVCIVLGIVLIPTSGLLGAVFSLIGSQLALLISYFVALNGKVGKMKEES